MDYKFLDKVIEQLVSETEVNDDNVINTPFFFPPITLYSLPSSSPFLLSTSPPFFPLSSFKKHCKDVYGIKDDQEIDYVWEKYKIIITGKINSKDNLNESTVMDNKFLDKVIDQLVSETIIVDGKIHLPFFPPYRPSPPPYLLSLLQLLRPLSFKRHCKEVYSLNDEQELDYVWDGYKQNISDKLDSKDNINESNGRDYKFLDKVVDQLVSETRLEYTVGIFTPFREDPFQIQISDSIFFSSVNPPNTFTYHMRGVYSVSKWGELDYVWDSYKQILKDKINSKDNINESTGMNYKFLDKVVDSIVDETVIDYDGDVINTPFQTISFFLRPILSSYTPTPSFKKHCRDVYSVKNEQEIEYVWNGYKEIIKKMLNSKGDINESIEMSNKFLDKVVGSLVDDTIIGDNGTITPFYTFLPLFSTTFIFSTFSSSPSSFKKHCKDVYGIKDEEEIKYVWDKYRTIILDKVESKTNINESIEMSNKFLDKVVGSLVDDTNMVDGRLLTPYYNESPIPTKDYIYSDRTYVPQFFKLYCEDVFGLSDRGEREYVWNNYKTMVIDKLDSKENINESREMDYKFLNRVIDQLVSETIVNDDKLYTPFDPPFPPLFVNRNRDVLFTSPVRPYSFKEHCKDVYSLNDREIEYIWNKYKEIITDKLKSKENINESREMDKGFIDKVAEQIMSETVIKMVSDDDGSVDGSFKTPFNGIHPLPRDFSLFFKVNFYNHCESVYGIKDYEEIHLIWDKYKSLVRTETGQPQRIYVSNRLF